LYENFSLRNNRTVFEELSLHKDLKNYGTSRNANENSKLIYELDYCVRSETLREILRQIHPSVVINCIGVTKHLKTAKNPFTSISVNSLLPHEIAKYCSEIQAKLVQISTDCVFSGKKGNYDESDLPDSTDLYGKSKVLGEVVDENHLTIRTSTIGHEKFTKFGLLEWFLTQHDQCNGFRNAFFSGLTTIELARVIKDILIANQDLNGLYHVGGKAISKFDLLEIIREVYQKEIHINPDDEFFMNRTLNSSLFHDKTGYLSPSWEEMIHNMYLRFKQ
jgi:dTDP-4-dehydrorhamnose reductase